MRTLREDPAFAFFQARVKAGAPYKFGDLRENLSAGTKLTRRQASMARQFGDPRSSAEIHFGTADPAGMMNEFGLGNNPVNPFFRREWEGSKSGILASIGRTLGDQITAAGVRAAKRRARGR
jgi:hypothetical protein